MVLIERLSKQIASKTAEALNLDQDREEVIAYGALNFFHTLFTTILLVAFGLLTGSLIEVLLIALTSASIRKYSGGIHADSLNHCAIVSVILFGGLSQIIKYVPVFTDPWVVILYQSVVGIAALILFMRLCPVESPNKPIRNPETRKRLRRSAIVLVFVFQLISVAFWFWYWKTNSPFALRLIASVSTGLLWQVISLTLIGRFIITKLELLLNKFGI